LSRRSLLGDGDKSRSFRFLIGLTFRFG
jgi:hypothetical protein